MSTNYKHNDRVPSETICTRLDELAHAVTLGHEAVAREFTMRIPAELDHDADVVLSEAARRIRELEAHTEPKFYTKPRRFLRRLEL